MMSLRLAEVVLAWLGYFALHSILAASSVKTVISRKWPRYMPGYRVAFNVIATLTLIPVLWLVHNHESSWLWQWRGGWAWVANAVAVLAIFCFVMSARAYGMDDFLGLRQLKAHDDAVAQTFTISFFHRFVRHPWYSISLALVWTRDMNESLLVSALAITVYFVVGSILEEHKLIESFGECYRRYRAAVPGLVPLPWKYLSAGEAKALMNQSFCGP